MAHNFRLTGDRYAGKADRGDGTSPDSAKNDLVALLGAMTTQGLQLIIGSGAWQGSIGGAVVAKPKWIADGTVIFTAADTVTPWAQPTGDGAAYSFEGIRWERFPSVLDPAGGGNSPLSMLRCFWYSCTNNFNSYNTGQDYTDCLFDNCTLSFQNSQGGANAVFTRCILWSGTYRQVNLGVQLSYSHLGPGATLYLNSNADLASITNSNIEGTLVVAGTPLTFAQARAAGLPASNISVPALYNKADAQDFTLKLASPHLSLGIGPSHLRFGTSYYFEPYNGASPGDDVTITNCRLRSTASPSYVVAVLETTGLLWADGGGMVVKPNSDAVYEGYILCDKIRLFDRAQRLRRWSIVAGLNFNTDFPGAEPVGNQGSANPSVFNSSVPAYANYFSGSAGRSPHRLAEQFRWSSNPLADVNGANTWQTGATFLDFEHQGELGYNPSPLRGSAHPDFDQTSANVQPIIARWIQPRFKLRNNFTSK